MPGATRRYLNSIERIATCVSAAVPVDVGGNEGVRGRGSSKNIFPDIIESSPLSGIVPAVKARKESRREGGTKRELEARCTHAHVCVCGDGWCGWPVVRV